MSVGCKPDKHGLIHYVLAHCDLAPVELEQLRSLVDAVRADATAVAIGVVQSDITKHGDMHCEIIAKLTAALQEVP